MKTFSQSNVQDWTFRDRPTLNFLLSCISANTDSQTTHHIQTLAQGEIDWQFLAQIAKDHRVVPLLYNRLNTTCPDTAPPC
jgi:hypothetical protein